MCKANYFEKVHRTTSKALGVTAGAGSESTTHQLNDADGPVVGFAVQPNYPDADMANILLTIKQADNTIGKETPATTYMPNESMPYFPAKMFAGNNIEFTVKSESANTVVATPVRIVFFHAPKNACQS